MAVERASCFLVAFLLLFLFAALANLPVMGRDVCSRLVAPPTAFHSLASSNPGKTDAKDASPVEHSVLPKPLRSVEGDAAPRIAVLRIDTRRTTDPYYAWVSDRLEKWADLHRYDVITILSRPFMPVYWLKAVALRNALTALPRYDFVFFVDSDAAPYRMGCSLTPLTDLCSGNVTMVIGTSPPQWDSRFIATGAFLVRNSQRAVHLVDDWLALYDAKRWENSGGGKWKSKDTWAKGLAYEQGSLNEMIATGAWPGDAVRIVDHSVLIGLGYPTVKEAFLVHYTLRAQDSHLARANMIEAVKSGKHDEQWTQCRFNISEKGVWFGSEHKSARQVTL